MLEELHVRDLALIEEAWLEFGPGMTVLTGETGAGKTALLGALKLLLGDRADSGSVRPGADEALVEGRFSAGADEIVVARRVGAEGRSKARLDGSMATAGELAARVGPMVDLHGQHEHQALLTPATHVRYLDRWAGGTVDAALAEYRAARSAHREAVEELARLEERVADAERRADYLRFVADEIGAVAPTPGEDAAIEARLPALQHAERLREGVASAVAAIRSEGGAAERAAEAVASLEKLAGIDPALDELASQVGEAAALLDDAGLALRSYRDSVEHDPQALAEAQGRLAELGGLVRKYGPTLDDVIAQADEARLALEAADAGEDGRARAKARLDTAETELRAAGTALAAARAAAAPGFVAALTEASRDLAMDGAAFEVAATDLPLESWTEDGPQRIEFLYAPSVGAPARPLARIASGGEISRVMLALKGVLGRADDVPVLVFDEVDAGIGGATAHAVGRRLAQLAQGRQVLVVTHLAQVAAYADHQLVVEKRVEDGRARTIVRNLTPAERVEEIARMLSGGGSDASRSHAEELLGSAREHLADAG